MVKKVPKISYGYKKKSYNNTKLLQQLKKNMISKANKKFHDVTLGTGVYATGDTYAFTLLNAVQEGVTETTRVGRQITISSIYLKGVVVSASSTTGSGFIRTIIVQDMQTNAAIFPITALLVTDDLSSQNNLDNSKRFRILHNEVLPISGIATQCNGTPTGQCIDWYKKVNITTEYNSTNGGSIADITKNSIYMLTIATSIGTTNLYSDVRIRIRFKDAN